MVPGYPLFFSEESSLQKSPLHLQGACARSLSAEVGTWRSLSFYAPRVYTMYKDWTKGILTHPKILGLVKGDTLCHHSWMLPFGSGNTKEIIQPLVADSLPGEFFCTSEQLMVETKPSTSLWTYCMLHINYSFQSWLHIRKPGGI